MPAPISTATLAYGAGPSGRFYAPPADGKGKSLKTHWPIVLSHPFSYTAANSFRGDTLDSAGSFDAYGVKAMLEAGGAVVYQPDKLAYASSENRGQLLYKKCAGTTLDEQLCKGSNPVEIDGIHLATRQYCADPALRARNGFADESQCQRGLQFNVICHSQGCLDSRYMLAAVRNEFSGELMYRHIVSWSSMAGANKGTAQADAYLELSASCLSPDCKSPVFDLALAADSMRQGQGLILNGSDSAVALTRKYVLLTTDMDCNPDEGQTCAPSFNQLYPLPVDPTHPILYQTFSSQIFNIDHPCYSGKKTNWQIVEGREGPNDGNISVDSQMFTTYGWGGTGAATPVLPRWVSGITLDPAHPHPGLEHMAYCDLKVPGMSDGQLSCNGEDNSMYRFSRIDLYRDIVAELVGAGF
ncbi:MAG: hypothetical protein Q8Q73_14440 [Stagnimonas sp.]|nr:hypothetical protein [Stagnimonas sp.]